MEQESVFSDFDLNQVINNLDFNATELQNFNTEQTTSLWEDSTEEFTTLQKFSVFLKPAKAREDQYEGGDFPKSLLCNPYKYDLKIQGDLLDENTDITLELVDAETKKTPNSSKRGITVETVEKNSKRERVIRFTINLCSFHFRRRAFRIAVLCSGGKQLYLSTPFRTYARRREHTQESPRKKQKISGDKYQNSVQVQETYFGSVNPTPIVGGSILGKRKLDFTQQHHYSEFPSLSIPLLYPTTNTVKQSVNVNPFTTLGPKERTTLAIQLMSSLSPIQREAVNLYLSCINPQHAFSHC
jgi:hypothetical protein